MYKWIDANGRVVYSDQPPPRRRQDRDREARRRRRRIPNAAKELAQAPSRRSSAKRRRKEKKHAEQGGRDGSARDARRELARHGSSCATARRARLQASWRDERRHAPDRDRLRTTKGERAARSRRRPLTRPRAAPRSCNDCSVRWSAEADRACRDALATLLLLQVGLVDLDVGLRPSASRGRRSAARGRAGRRCGALAAASLRRLRAPAGRSPSPPCRSRSRRARSARRRTAAPWPDRPGRSASAPPAGSPAAAGCAPSVNRLPNVTPASLSLLPCSSSASFSRPGLLRQSRSPPCARAGWRISSLHVGERRAAPPACTRRCARPSACSARPRSPRCCACPASTPARTAPARTWRCPCASACACARVTRRRRLHREVERLARRPASESACS